jgi:hypothetical protein
MIFAYALEGIRPDTLNPTHVRPDYIMQSGKGGAYILSNIALGPYRLFAVRDEYRNLLYDRDVDQVGIASGDVYLAAGRNRVEGINFVMMKEDTTRLSVTGANAVNRRLVDIRFSEPADSSRFAEASFEIMDTLSGRAIPVAAAFVRRAPASTAGLVTAVPLDSGRTYRLRAKGIVDRAGNPVDSGRAAVLFEGSSRADTVRTLVTVAGLRDSVRGIFPETVFELEFSEPVSPAPLRNAITIRDTMGREVRAELRWEDAAHARLVPSASLASRTWDRFAVVLDSVRNYRATRYRDSVLVIRFQTLDMRTTGSVEGFLADDDAPRARNGYVVKARSTNLTPVNERTLVLPRAGKFVIDRLIEGSYTVFTFEDRDSTGRHSSGSPFPFVPSARFAVYPDTVRVRARWAVEGVQLRFGR